MAKKPRGKSTKCPYTGHEVEAVYNERLNRYAIRGAYDPGRWYTSEQEAWFHFSTRGGVKPGIPEFPPKISVSLPNQRNADPGGDLNRTSDLIEERTEQLAKELTK